MKQFPPLSRLPTRRGPSRLGGAFLLGSAAIALCLAAAPAPAPSFTSPPLKATTSWIGNSLGGARGWVQQDIHALTVTPEGTVFTDVEWDEGGGNAGEFRDGKLVRYAMHTHGWGNQGGAAVAANSRYLYLGAAMENEGGGLKDPDTWPPKGRLWQGISRRPRADISRAAPFPGGKGGKGDTLKGCFLVVAEVPDHGSKPLAGLCADEHQVYAADQNAGEMRVFDAETMEPVRRWKVDRPGPLAPDPSGLVWMLQRAAPGVPARLRLFGADRRESREIDSLELPAGVNAQAFCRSPDGRIWVADDGPAQQIRIYRREGDRLVETGRFGTEGGIAHGVPGQFGNLKLNHVTALGFDAHENLYLAQDAQSGGGGTVLESYHAPDQSLNWRLFGLTFVDMGDLDPAEDTEAFSKEEHFHLDYTRAPGAEWSYTGYTIGRFKYPEDPRLHIWSAGAWIRRLHGQRILFVNDMNSEHLQAYRFAPRTDGEVAIPSGLFAKQTIKAEGGWPPHQPARGEWIWRDANGDGAFEADEFAVRDGANSPPAQGWWVDAEGGVWSATETQGLRYFPLEGFDDHGNPRWSYTAMRTFPHPGGFQEVKRLRYDAAGDVLYLGGTTAEHRNQHWKPMGPVAARYDGWLRGARQERWRVTLPYARGSSGHESCEPMGFDVAGEFLFAPYTGASRKDGVATGRVEVFRAADGQPVGHFEPGPEVGEVGLQDLRETLTAHRRADGEYVVLLEDDYKSKIVMYRWRP